MTTNSPYVLPDVSEKTFQQQVLDLAKLTGWRTYHVHDSRRSNPGFPDLVLVRRGRMVFAELKTRKGRVSREQQAWLDDLRACPTAEVFLWRPDDLPVIAKVLGR